MLKPMVLLSGTDSSFSCSVTFGGTSATSSLESISDFQATGSSPIKQGNWMIVRSLSILKCDDSMKLRTFDLISGTENLLGVCMRKEWIVLQIIR